MGWLKDHMNDAAKTVDSAAGNGITWVSGKAVDPLVKRAQPGRPLTDNEITMLKDIYGDSVDYDSVRICHGRLTDKITRLMAASGITVLGNIILIRENSYSDDFTVKGPAGLLVHEMAHIWQLQNGGLSLTEGVSNTIKRACSKLGIIDMGKSIGSIYNYKLEAGKDLLDFGMEQQASIIQDYYNQAVRGYIPGRMTNESNISPAECNKLYEQTLKNFLTANAAPGYRLH